MEKKYLATHIRCVFLILGTLLSSLAKGQSSSPEEYQVKAVFLYNFTRFIEWPATSFNSSSSPFVIGIIGGNPFGSFLEEAIKDESVGMHKIIIRHYSDFNLIGDCHILFINYKDKEMIKQTLAAVKDKNILTVNEWQRFVEIGGMVQFINEGNRIKLIINNNAVKSARMQASSKLLSVAQIYD